MICFIESCHFTSVVYMIMIISSYQPCWIFRVNILNFIWYGGSNECPACYYLTITWRQTEVDDNPAKFIRIAQKCKQNQYLALSHHWFHVFYNYFFYFSISHINFITFFYLPILYALVICFFIFLFSEIFELIYNLIKHNIVKYII